MNKLLVALVALGSIMAASVASAGTATATWTNPTANTDGSAIPATGAGSLVSSRVEYGSCNGAAFGAKAGEVVVAQPSRTTTITLPPGSYCFRAFVTNTYGNESAASMVAAKIVGTPIPNPPVLTTISTTAYRINLGTDRINVVAIGTVPLHLACDSKQNVNGLYNVVDRTKVTWSTASHPSVVVAKCG